MDMDDDPPEVQDLERTAEWRLRCVDQNPLDSKSTEAAALLQRLANELRALQGSTLYRELGAICNWLAESDDISDFAQRGHDYRRRIGIDVWPESGEAYLRTLLDMAKL